MKLKISTMDILGLKTMKNAAKCDNFFDMQELGEKRFRTQSVS